MEDFERQEYEKNPWLWEAYGLLKMKSWPGRVHIEEEFRKAQWPISLHEAIADARLGQWRKYNT